MRELKTILCLSVIAIITIASSVVEARGKWTADNVSEHYFFKPWTPRTAIELEAKALLMEKFVSFAAIRSEPMTYDSDTSFLRPMREIAKTLVSVEQLELFKRLIPATYDGWIGESGRSYEGNGLRHSQESTYRAIFQNLADPSSPRAEATRLYLNYIWEKYGDKKSNLNLEGYMPDSWNVSKEKEFHSDLEKFHPLNRLMDQGNFAWSDAYLKHSRSRGKYSSFFWSQRRAYPVESASRSRACKSIFSN